MAIIERTKITKEGLEELQKELLDRKTVLKQKLQDQLDEELQEGDISENANYYKLQDDIASNDRRIEELDDIINNAKVVKSNGDKKAGSKAGIGSKVTLKQGDNNFEYTLVGSTEADPTTKRVSVESPVGKALIGKKKGDTVTIKLPTGNLKYDIIEVL